MTGRMRRHQRPGPAKPGAAREADLDAAVEEEVAAQEVRAPRIVVGVDGSPESMRALVWAVAEARARAAVLEIVHVDVFRHEVMALFGPGVLQSERAVLDEAVSRARALEPSVVVDARLCEPPAGEALVDASEDAELLVVGSSGAGGFTHLALGSVSAECALHARCPVVIVPSIARLAQPRENAGSSAAANGRHLTAGDPD